MVSSRHDELVVVRPYNQASLGLNFQNFLSQTQTQPGTFERLKALAPLYLNVPYLFEPLGEGLNAPYYQEPLYRSDRFDCVTFVDTLLALYQAYDFDSFTKNLLALRYTHARPEYTERTDWFTDLEWLPRAQALGYLAPVKEASLASLLKTAKTLIDKPNWYAVKTLSALHLTYPLNEAEALQKLADLRAEGHRFKAVESTLDYLPLTTLFESPTQQKKIFDLCPEAMIAISVRPNWNIRDEFLAFPQGYGTNLNVSHLGLVLRQEGRLIFYHASSQAKKVVSLPLETYLKEFLAADTVKGLHLAKIL